MVKYENDCVGCPREMGCIGELCSYFRVPHFYCDVCGDESDDLYVYGDEHVCKFCLEKYVPKLKVEDYYE